MVQRCTKENKILLFNFILEPGTMGKDVQVLLSHSFTHPINKYLLNTYYMLGTF